MRAHIRVHGVLDSSHGGLQHWDGEWDGRYNWELEMKKKVKELLRRLAARQFRCLEVIQMVVFVLVIDMSIFRSQEQSPFSALYWDLAWGRSS